MRVEVASSHRTISIDVIQLSRNLALDAEVFLIEGDSKKSIGFFSHKMLVYFASEFAEYAMKNYLPNGMAERNLLGLVRKWLEDPDSVSPDTMHKISSALNSVIFSSYSTRISANTASSAISAADYAAMASPSPQAERERQGKFIIDFLRSDKALFLL